VLLVSEFNLRTVHTGTEKNVVLYTDDNSLLLPKILTDLNNLSMF